MQTEDITGTKLSQFACSVILMENPKISPRVHQRHHCRAKSILLRDFDLHLSCTDSSVHPVALFQLPKGLQHHTNHLLSSSLINSVLMVSNQAHQIIESSCHTLSFRKGSGTKLLWVYKLSFQIHLQCLFPFQIVGGS